VSRFAPAPSPPSPFPGWPPPRRGSRYHHLSVAVREIAAFDLDGTITRRDCLLPFFARVAGRPRLALALARHSMVLVAASRHRDRRDDAKLAVSGSLLRGRRADDVAELGERFAGEVAAGWMREDVVRRLGWHLDAGHEVVLVTASFGVYARPLGERLGVSRVVATELEVDGDGRLTGRLAGRNCRAEEKVRRLAGLYGDPPVLDWAYGDSPDDRAMLARAAHPVEVGPDALTAAPA
jgi:phosphatidylglycerophosphatase C